MRGSTRNRGKEEVESERPGPAREDGSLSDFKGNRAVRSGVPTRASHSQIVQNSLSCALLRCALPALDANES